LSATAGRYNGVVAFAIFRADAKSILSVTSGFIAQAGFTHSLTPARNCGFGCTYCYVPTMGIYGGLKPEDWRRWGEFTTFKANAPELLARSLRPEQVIYCSPLVDPYQPAEASEQMMPPLLDALIDHIHLHVEARCGARKTTYWWHSGFGCAPPAGANRSGFFRRTDLAVKATVPGMNPLSVSADKIAIPAMRAAALLATITPRPRRISSRRSRSTRRSSTRSATAATSRAAKPPS
jgi:hypothetical protein